MNWSILLAHEFNNQAELEKKQGLEVTPNFTFKDMKSHYQGQIGFIGTSWHIFRLPSFSIVERNWTFLPRAQGIEQLNGKQQVQTSR